METRVYLPYRGEFGHKIMWHAPTVFYDQDDKIVGCEHGEEALFPGADSYLICEKKIDRLRREHVHHDEEFLTKFIDRVAAEFDDQHIEFIFPSRNRPKRYFIPKPYAKQNIVCDIVVCPRHRVYGNNKNWPHWPYLTSELMKNYAVFAAGSVDASYPMPCRQAWDFERSLDASIEAILSSSCVIATDAGLAHLAILCGKPVFLITHLDGFTAPGYNKVQMGRYIEENHTNQKITQIKNAWNDPDRVLAAILKSYE